MRGFSLVRVDTRNEIRDFPTSRRAKLKVADVGLPDDGTRRVPGLRREEVAVLADVSVPYYTRLERGDLAGASDRCLCRCSRSCPTVARSTSPATRSTNTPSSQEGRVVTVKDCFPCHGPAEPAPMSAV